MSTEDTGKIGGVSTQPEGLRRPGVHKRCSSCNKARYSHFEAPEMCGNVLLGSVCEGQMVATGGHRQI